jgi:hypothetical protein
MQNHEPRTSYPDQLCHYYFADGQPFRNVMTLESNHALAVMTERFPADSKEQNQQYLTRRCEVENWLRTSADTLGIERKIDCPIYFSLGETDWLTTKFAQFDRGYRVSKIPLCYFSDAPATFTFPDSFFSKLIAETEKPLFQKMRESFHGHVYRLDELHAFVAKFGYHGDRWKTDSAWKLNNYIEVQVWDTVPIQLAEQGGQPDAFGAGYL